MSENTAKPTAMKFGITKDTKAVNSAPLLTATKLDTPSTQFPAGYKFPIAKLVNVVFNGALERKDGTTTPVLQFVFTDKDKRSYTHTEWVIDPDDAKADTKQDGMNVRIMHIYTSVFKTFPEEGVGAGATSYADFFEKVAAAFNNSLTDVVVEGKDAPVKKKTYTLVNLYYKLTYYKTRVQFPLSPNFLERVVPNQPCKLLAINTTYDKLEPTGAAGGGGIPGIGAAPTGDIPSFEEEYN